MSNPVSRPVTVLMIHTAIIIVALFELSGLPVELSPDADLPRMVVVASYPGASSELVVHTVTLPIEEAASTLSGVKEVSSTTFEGGSTVNIQLQKNADIDFVRLNLLEKMNQVAEHFPNGVSFPRIVKYVPEDFRSLQGFMSYSIHGDLPLSDIQKFAESDVKTRILSVRGVASIRILGGARRYIYVLADRDKMRAFGIGYQDLMRSIQERQYVKSAGQITEGKVRKAILTGNEITNTEDLGNIIVGSAAIGGRGGSNGPDLRLHTFCRIVDSIGAPTSIVRINGQPTVTIEIDKEPGVNMLRVSSDVNKEVSHIRSLVPRQLFIDKISDRSVDVRREVEELSRKAVYSGLLILFVTFLFFFSRARGKLPNSRQNRDRILTNLVVAVVLVMSVLFAVGVGIIFLAVSGVGLNVITLAALALSLGIAIDNNVVVSESIYHIFECSETCGRGDIVRIISEALSRIRLPLTAATLTTVGALAPVFFLPEELRPYFISFAETSGIVVLASLIVSFTLVPVCILILIRSGLYLPPEREPHAMEILKKGYGSALTWLLRHRKIAVLISVWLVGVPVWLLPDAVSYKPGTATDKLHLEEKALKALTSAYNSTFGSRFYTGVRPYIDYGFGGSTHLFFRHVYKGEIWRLGADTYLVMSVYAPQGTPVEKTDEFARQIEAVVLPGKNWAKLITTRVSSEYASVRVDFADSVAITSIPLIFKNTLMSLAAQAGGFTVAVSGFGPGFYSGGGAVPNFSISASGYNYRSVKEIAEKVRQLLVKNPRVDNVQIDRLPWRDESYEIFGVVDKDYLEAVESNTEEFVEALSPFISSSLAASSIVLDNEPVNLIVKFGDYAGQSIENLPGYSVTVGNNRLVNIGHAVEFKKRAVMPVIERKNQEYIRYTTFDFRGPYEFGDAYAEQVVKSVTVPPGYDVKRISLSFTFGQKQFVPMVLLSLLSILIVFMVTASLYESYKNPFAVILSVPMSIVGLFAIFFLLGANFGRGGYASLLFLVGLSVNNGILLVDRIGVRLRHEENQRSEDRDTGTLECGKPGVREGRLSTIVSASQERLRPIVMTTLITIAGFIPFVINADAYSFWYSFSLGIIGGILVSSLLILLFTPVFYDLIGGTKFHKGDDI